MNTISLIKSYFYNIFKISVKYMILNFILNKYFYFYIDYFGTMKIFLVFIRSKSLKIGKFYDIKNENISI